MEPESKPRRSCSALAAATGGAGIAAGIGAADTGVDAAGEGDEAS